MKKLLILIAIAIISLFALSSCSDAQNSESSTSSQDSTTDTTDTEDDATDDTEPDPEPPEEPEPPPDPEPPVEPEPEPIPEPEPPVIDPPVIEPVQPEPEPIFYPKFIIKTGADPTNDYFLSDGTTTEPWISGQVTRADTGLYTNADQLTQYDVSADPSPSVELLTTPTSTLKVNDDIYYCREFTATESEELGAQARIHTEIYRNQEMISFFALNQWGCSDIISVTDNVWIIDTNGGYHPVETSPDNIIQVITGRFFIYERNIIDKTVMVSDGTTDTLNNYETNWTFTGSQWQLSDGVEYSESGTTWSQAAGLTDLATAMQDFNEWPYPIVPEAQFGETPVFLIAGEYEGLLFWIECNSGWLFAYDPVGDTISQSWRLYAGDGTSAAGVLKRASLSPFLDGSQLYFSEPGVVSVLDIESGFITVFYGGDGVVLPF